MVYLDSNSPACCCLILPAWTCMKLSVSTQSTIGWNPFRGGIVGVTLAPLYNPCSAVHSVASLGIPISSQCDVISVFYQSALASTAAQRPKELRTTFSLPHLSRNFISKNILYLSNESSLSFHHHSPWSGLAD